ncbi:hypothetical protein B296_00018161 [Ensete ventricosum]|uniref:Uncharacterized protein n=1 Tax=Ensete ventricosum TaxID=4639 RepID=A0A427B449_ENSVE|nr:hypothetical protein B296_00018161 [Ensete ventricosum]
MILRGWSQWASPCCEKAHTNKGAWTKEEDQKLISYIKAHGEGCWRSLPKAAGPPLEHPILCCHPAFAYASVLVCTGLLRCGKSCRLRWINYLRPDLKRGNFTEEEDELIIKLHGLLGNKWSLIAGRLPGRTDNEIKNYWNTHIKRKLLSRGIDPQTHGPINGGATAAFPAPHPPETAVPKASATDSYDETNSSGGSQDDDQDGYLDLNLALSISLPHRSPKRSQPSEPLTSAATSSSPQAICLCCHLGFQSSEACSCHTTENPHVLRVIRRLEEAQH